MNDAPELYAIVKEWEKELKRKKNHKRKTKGCDMKRLTDENDPDYE